MSKVLQVLKAFGKQINGDILRPIVEASNETMVALISVGEVQ